jgi:hypothetical protein
MSFRLVASASLVNGVQLAGAVSDSGGEEVSWHDGSSQTVSRAQAARERVKCITLILVTAGGLVNDGRDSWIAP